MPRMRLAAAGLGLLSAGLVACADQPELTGPAPSALFSCLLGEAEPLDVGDVLQFTGAEANNLCLNAGGAEYLLVPFFASSTGSARLEFELTGGGIRAAGGPPSPALAPAPDSLTPDDGFHARLREREHTLLQRNFPQAQRLRSSLQPSPARVTVPAEGELLTLNTSTQCERLDRRTGRVEAVTRTAIVVSDTANPRNGFTEADWRSFGEAFDTLVNPVATRHFGEPTDIDENGRVVIFFTRAVNELTPPNSGSFVSGFFWAGDLFPQDLCRGSNVREIFYMLVPDPTGEVNNNPRPTSLVRRISVSVLAHEYQHLINASRRLYINEAQSFETVWLNEGLSHIAEELLFYAASEAEPRQNIDVERLRASESLRNAFNSFAISNFFRFLTYLEEPTEESLFGIDNLPTRGAVWAFLRYAADHEEGDDVDFFRSLVNTRETGVDNLAQVLSVAPLDRVQDWTVSVYTDDAVSDIPPLYTQPSWNFRSIMPVLAASENYPLEVITPDANESRSLTLQGGGAAFLRFGTTAAGERALVHTTVGGVAPPSGLRLSLVRTR